MPNNTIGWGQAAANNSNGFGAGAVNNSKDWGYIHSRSYGHDETNLTGVVSFFEEFGTPNIGYSTMLLGSVVNQTETRRSSDDATQNDTAAQIQSRLLSWVNTDVNLYTSDFSTGADAFGGDGGAAAGNIDGIGGEDDTLRFTSDATNGQHYLSKGPIFNADGSTVRVQTLVYIPSTNTTIDGVRIWTGFGGDGFTDVTTLDSWVSVDFDLTNDSGTNYRANGLNGASLGFAGTSGDVFYIKTVILTQENADGLIRTWYNIGSEASADLQNTTASEQPEIVSDGVLQTIGTDPAINFTSAFRCLFNSGGFSFMAYAETFSVDIDLETGSDVTTRNMILAQRNGANDRFGLTIFAGRLYVEGFNGAYAGNYYNIAANTRYKLTIVWNNGSNTVYLNGSALTPDGASAGLLGSVSSEEFVLGNDRSLASSNPYLGKLASVLVYDSAKDGAHNTGFTNAY